MCSRRRRQALAALPNPKLRLVKRGPQVGLEDVRDETNTAKNHEDARLKAEEVMRDARLKAEEVMRDNARLKAEGTQPLQQRQKLRKMRD